MLSSPDRHSLLVEPLDSALDKLKHRFPQLSLALLRQATREIREVISLCEKLGVRRPISFRPTMSHSFFRSGILFECVRVATKREVLAVGGRYVSSLVLSAVEEGKA
jgi:histidyl-tRNA synthetase